jgi:hypothetical protein
LHLTKLTDTRIKAKKLFLNIPFAFLVFASVLLILGGILKMTKLDQLGDNAYKVFAFLKNGKITEQQFTKKLNEIGKQMNLVVNNK